MAVIQSQSKDAWRWFEDTVRDVTADQANWWPPGTANSIGSTYLHVVINTDVEINRLIRRRKPLVESRWKGSVGQGAPYLPDRFDRWVRHVEVDWPVLRQYGQAVSGEFLAALDDFTQHELEMPVDMSRSGLGTWQGRALIRLHGSSHVHIHGGEIACLKGLQGGTGWTESEAFRAAVSVEDIDQ
jgi:hypothetical protein